MVDFRHGGFFGGAVPGRPGAGTAPPSRVPGLARAQGCASEPGPNIVDFRMVTIWSILFSGIF